MREDRNQVSGRGIENVGIDGYNDRQVKERKDKVGRIVCERVKRRRKRSTRKLLTVNILPIPCSTSVSHLTNLPLGNDTREEERHGGDTRKREVKKGLGKDNMLSVKRANP